MTIQPHQLGNVFSGSGAPSTTPIALGVIYVDTSRGEFWISKGASSVADWAKITPTRYFLRADETVSAVDVGYETDDYQKRSGDEAQALDTVSIQMTYSREVDDTVSATDSGEIGFVFLVPQNDDTASATDGVTVEFTPG
jgi:hypothetical protein